MKEVCIRLAANYIIQTKGVLNPPHMIPTNLSSKRTRCNREYQPIVIQNHLSALRFSIKFENPSNCRIIRPNPSIYTIPAPLILIIPSIVITQIPFVNPPLIHVPHMKARCPFCLIYFESRQGTKRRAAGMNLLGAVVNQLV